MTGLFKKEKKKKTSVKKGFNGLTASEWTILSRNVWNDIRSPRSKKHLIHGATFPKELIVRIIKMYSKKDDIVLDPFVGLGTTLQACLETQRRGIGIELNPVFGSVAKNLEHRTSLDQFIEPTDKKKKRIKVKIDDCRNLKAHVKDASVQLVVTSPPYANFIQRSVKDRKTKHKQSLITMKNKSVVKPYSDNDRDFGNLEYDNFLKDLKTVLMHCFDVTKSGGYGIWIIKDYRDTKNNIPYIPFHSDIAKLGVSVGFKFHDLIIWDQNEQRSLVLLGFPSVFYTNQNCSFLVVFRKPHRS